MAALVADGFVLLAGKRRRAVGPLLTADPPSVHTAGSMWLCSDARHVVNALLYTDCAAQVPYHVIGSCDDSVSHREGQHGFQVVPCAEVMPGHERDHNDR